MEVLKAEFREKDGEVPLNPSVYDVADDHAAIVQTYAEHYASSGLDPRKLPSQVHVFVSQVYDGPVKPDDGDFSFQHLARTHCELSFRDQPHLLGFIQNVLDNLMTLGRRTTRDDLERYVRYRFEHGDLEWKSIVAEDPRWNNYLPDSKS